jgi:hypothetical protein
MPLSSVLGAQSLVRPGVCTSSTRPASPFEGQTIYETDTDLVKSYNGTSWVTIGPTTVPTAAITAVGAANVATAQTTTSTSYTDLSTSGPATTVTTGTTAIVQVHFRYSNSSGNANNDTGIGHMSFDVSGATTLAAADARCAQGPQIHLSHTQTRAGVFYVTGLTAGSNTFTAKYKVSGVTPGTGTFSERNIVVFAI